MNENLRKANYFEAHKESVTVTLKQTIGSNIQNQDKKNKKSVAMKQFL